jgi:hypothetical protein
MVKKFWKRFVIWMLVIPTLTFSVLVGTLFWKQKAVVQELVDVVNADFEGELEIGGSHISPFANFPYISIDLERVRVFEDKSKATPPLLDVQDIYLGFNLWDVLGGTLDIQSLKLKDGSIKLVQHTDGSFNIANALSSKKQIEDVNAEFHLNLNSIQLVNIDLIKLNEENNILLDFFVAKARSRFNTSPNHVMVALESTFELSIIVEGDTTFIHHKHFDIDTQLDFVSDKQLLVIKPSIVKLEQALFRMEGSVDLDDDMNINVQFEGEKPNFDLFMAFAPEELAPTLKRYENGGKVYFRTRIVGKSANGHNPLVEADFGCEAAFFDNTTSGKKLDELFFKGHFTNGEQRNASTMEFSLVDVSAKPEAGVFSGSLFVKNFDSPEIDLKIRSEFELEFLANFLNLTELQGLMGSVALTMNFHDIVDLSRPERSIEKVNESYFTELDVKDLSFRMPDYHLPVHQVNIKASMEGHKAKIEKFNFKVGDSDLQLSGTISDLPAILHHTSDPVSVVLNVDSKLLDFYQLTAGDTLKKKPVNEQIRDLRMKFKFKSSARAFTESPNFPVGEFFVEDLYAKLTHYPHAFHDFHADVFVDENNFRIIDFTGMIDKSDFHFSGKLNNYDLWFNDDPLGDTKVEFNLTSTLLLLEDLFSYGGENYVPEDYRHEEFRNLKVHGFADLHFNKGLKSSDVTIDQLEASMKVHPMRLEKFKGRVHYEDEHLVVEKLSGKIGNTEFTTNLNYYFGKDDAVRKRDNYFSLHAPHLDFDELFNYNPPPAGKTETPEDHEAGFNIFDVPFTDMKVQFNIEKLNYHRYQINELVARARIQKNHFIYIDTMSLMAAGGTVRLNGYFNGSDRTKIYFSPQLTLDNVDLDKLLFKFENFGQDHLVSENLHGKISGKITGKLHMHADMIPIVDDSEIRLDMEVTNGRLENYSAFEALSDFFRDKNLKKVLFDTLRNHIDVTRGVMSIPNMTINSSLGFIEISGKQDMNMNMEYYIRVPLKLVTQVAMQKLFGEKKEIDSEVEDEIQYKDETKRIRFINLKISGTPENYKISLQKDKNLKKK